MKGIIVVLCTLYLASFAAAQLDEGVRTCLQNAGASLADVPSLLRDKSDEGLQKVGCITACIMQNAGVMNGNVIDVQGIDGKIDQIAPTIGYVDELRETVHQCAKTAANDDPCQVARTFSECGASKLRLRFGQMLPVLSV